MSIEREGKMYHLYCDICEEEADRDFYDFREATDYKKANGWESRREDWGKGNDGWYDVCPGCQKEATP